LKRLAIPAGVALALPSLTTPTVSAESYPDRPPPIIACSALQPPGQLLDQRSYRAIPRQQDCVRHPNPLVLAFRRIAPYAGFRREGFWLHRFPIPSYIVACETMGYSGEGRWLARNRSGAQGPAQLLGQPAPDPAMTDSERLRYWQVTRSIWLNVGPRAWACA
jgi:hypothetical protein